MIYIFHDKGVVFRTIYNTDVLTEEEKQLGVQVDTIPEAEVMVGKTPVLKYDELDGTLFYIYVDRPVTQEDRITDLEQQNAQMLLALVTNDLI